MADHEILAHDTEYFTEAGLITDKPVIIWGYAVDTDAVNDLSIEIWNADKTKLIFPRIIWEAQKKDKKPVMVKARESGTGLWLEAKTSGYFRFVPFYKEWFKQSAR